ncbi:MAG: hypothetical protein M5U01_42995 [Ardenticatenaceae bacterium]|nr:hypothetical protein [Ardenticatenaceae bacterium]
MSENRSATPVAFALQRITLHEGVNPDDFEKFMLAELFPIIATHGENEGPDQHFLLSGGSNNEYTWMSRLEYWIHQTPLPTWLLNRVERMGDEARGKLDRFGILASPEIFYDVTGWRARLGK